MGKATPVNPALELLELQENRGYSANKRIPTPFLSVREKFIQAKEKGQRVLIENAELSSAHAVAIKIDYIADRWCMGYQTLLHFGQEIQVPYTIHYADVYGAKENERRRSSRQVKIIFEGENPFE